MNIVLIGGQQIPGIGGAENYMFNLARTLVSLNHKVTIICSGRNLSLSTVEDVTIVTKKCPKSNFVALPLLFFKSISYILANRKDIDVVNFQAIFMAFFPGWIYTLLGLKCVYTIHSLAEDNPKYGSVVKTLISIWAYISIWCCGNNILTVSKSKASEIKKRYGKECKVVPCGVDLPTETYNCTSILERFTIRKGCYYLTIGRIDPVKNLDTLIKAFNQKKNKDYQLVIAGDYGNNYGNLLRELSATNNQIVFVGSVLGDDKETLLRNCFANCLVSSSEGMPISLLEAMAYGKPSVVSDISAIREIIQEDWGYWCKSRDVKSLIIQMNKIEDDGEDRAKISKEMSLHIKNNYTWNHIAKVYVDYLRDN